MYEEFALPYADAPGQIPPDTDISGNDVPPLPEDTETGPEMETETVADPETASGSPALPLPSVVTVSGNVVTVADSSITSGMDSLNGEMLLLNESMGILYENQSETNDMLSGIITVLVMFFGFTVFKWCEQKIKRFVKGVFNRYE